ncbi:MAG: peptidyl-prolyl cis-trans isomerase [Bdellovibrionaceae bacterium]|nr:peptidyl-prolyl cis-trans isomerase [Pseudobdellovibrionaceae bacterium]
MVEIKTSKGTIVVELDKKKAPETVNNFLAYTKDKFYDGTIFHRVIDNFMIQGGGFTDDMKEKDTKKPIQNEADNGLNNDKYTIAMARTGDPHSASAQFFINVKDNGALNHRGKTAAGWGYTVFGKVTKGSDVVDAIKEVKTETRKTAQGQEFEDVPVDVVKIESIRIKK